jgi:hypothetical protein
MILPDGLIFNRNRLDENIFFINDLFLKYKMSWTFVIKAFANYPDDFIREISNLDCKSIATENENHLKIIKELNPKIETWFLNYAAKKVNANFIDVNLIFSIPSRTSIEELERLSIATTSKPSFCNSTTVCEPINPKPPVTSIFIFFR